MKITRRNAAVAALAAIGAGSASARAMSEAKAVDAMPVREKGPKPDPSRAYWTNPKGGERIAMILYPGMTALDLIGPHYFFATMRGAKVDMVYENLDPVACDRNVTLVPTATYDDIDEGADLIFLPGGGKGTLRAMEDDTLISFLRKHGPSARYMSSVCTGVLILGAAGLLDGYRATGHWKLRDQTLPSFGAIPVNQRYVVDRSRITGAGVTAGIDFGMRLVSLFRGPDYARILQLIAEYDPMPPYDSGTPEKAWPDTAKIVADLLPEYNLEAIEIAKRRMAELKT